VGIQAGKHCSQLTVPGSLLIVRSFGLWVLKRLLAVCLWLLAVEKALGCLPLAIGNFNLVNQNYSQFRQFFGSKFSAPVYGLNK
jgi:hypothetical protein